ncbi:MAG: CAP domain-containing protein [Spirulinaceae cyanobacterium]
MLNRYLKAGAMLAIAAGLTATLSQTVDSKPLVPQPSAPQEFSFSPQQPADQPLAFSADDQAEFLDTHNAVRAEVGLPPLVWSPEIAAIAQDWADHLAENGFRMQHRSMSDRQQYNIGENIFWSAGQQSTPTQVVNSWASEKKDYNYRNNSCRGVCGHYTQIVWRDTTAVGCGMASGTHPRYGRQEIWVCNYNPPGNYRGQKPY